jgi:hypothetical protein
VIFKVDFEKSYDKVNWNFLHHMMIKKGFGDKWCDWVMRTVRGGKVAIKTNDRVVPILPPTKVSDKVALSPPCFLILLLMGLLVWFIRPRMKVLSEGSFLI